MKRSLMLLVLLSSVGCNSVRRIMNGPDSPMPEQHNVNPNDFYVTGTTTVVDDAVTMAVKGHTISVEIMRSGVWVTLQGRYVDYIAFTYPDEGVRFLNGSTPAGTQYRIHSVKA